MPLHLDQAGFEANSRLAATVHASHVLRAVERWRTLLPADEHAMVMILLSVIAIGGDRLLRTDLPGPARRLDGPLDPALLAPVNLSSIAHATGLNRETARRKVNALVDRGFLVRSADGNVGYREGLLREQRTLTLLHGHIGGIAAIANQRSVSARWPSERLAGATHNLCTATIVACGFAWIGRSFEELMIRYRFRTAGLLGRWRSRRSEAEDDAVRAGQALRGGADGRELVWRVPGRIEAEPAPSPEEK